MGVHLAARRWLRGRLGIDVHLVPPRGFVRITKSTVEFEIDPEFTARIDTAIERSGDTSVASEGEPALRQRQKFYNLVQSVAMTRGVDGLVAECGCFRGLTSHLICSVLAGEVDGFKGENVHLFDSFQGLSAPGEEDRVVDARTPRGKQKRQQGMFAASVDVVRSTLCDFPEVVFHPGWIPESLTSAPEGLFRFVHLDLDLHDPTKACLEYFFPRLAQGGAIMCDDYGSIRWPGVRRAVDDFCSAHSVRALRLASGQVLLFASGEDAEGRLPLASGTT